MEKVRVGHFVTAGKTNCHGVNLVVPSKLCLVYTLQLPDHDTHKTDLKIMDPSLLSKP